MKVNGIDLDGGRYGGGNLARVIANGGSVADLRTNGTLRKEEWMLLDTAVVQSAQKRLRVVAELRRRGLVYNLANALGTTVLETETVGGMNDAQIDMMGKTRGVNDAVEFEIGYLPIPIIHKAFEINARKLAASRKIGQPLDTLQAQMATFKVSEAIEKLTIVGTGGLTYGGGTIYGIENFTGNSTGSLTAAWTGASARDPITDVQAMKQALISQLKFGPFLLIVPTAYETALDSDYVATTSTTITIRQRLMQLEGIAAIMVSDHASANKVSLVDLSPETIRMVIGQDPAPVEWNSGDNMTMYFKVMSIMVPQIRQDQDGNCGIAVYTA